MTRKSLNIISTLILVLIVSYENAQTQGCSDAGICTINSFKPYYNDNDWENKNQLKVGFSFGSADMSITVFGSYIEYNRQISENFGIDTKITSLLQSGNGISNFGISDIYLTGNYKVNEKLKLSLGTKIPLTDGNKMQDNIALPMDYQSSLGTFDLILGIGYEIDKVQFVLAYQQPLIQNKNEFLSESYPINSKLRDFQSTNKFKRSEDILLRVSYPILLGDKLILTPSILPIYHLANDKYTNALGIENEIIGSQGLTLNGNVYFDYEFNSRNVFQINIGMPFVVRNKRPDGLTRSFIVNFEYRIKF